MGTEATGRGERIHRRFSSRERCPSGQREQTVNLPALAFEGSNPSLSTEGRRIQRRDGLGHSEQTSLLAGVAQLARASAFQAEGRGFEPRLPLTAHIAQLVEHLHGKEKVISSILIVGSREVK
jgi:hypothetical protein